MPLPLVQALAIGAAGFVGALARYYVQLLGVSLFGRGFPIGTMFINLSGSFILGWFMARFGARLDVSVTLKLAVATGFVGSYTTFSTWALDSFNQLSRGEWGLGALNLIGSLVLGVAAVGVGAWCAGDGR